MREPSRLVALVLSASVLTAAMPRPAFADGPAPSGASAVDTVRTNDGRLFRGTLVEKDPKGSVTIQLPSGELRTLPMSEVAYAGPSAKDPSASTGASSAGASSADASSAGPPAKSATGTSGHAGTTVPVHLEADQPHLALHVRTGQAQLTGTMWGMSSTGHGAFGFGSASALHYELVCTAPCDGQAPVGEQRVGISVDGGPVRELAEPLVLRGPASLYAEYENRIGWRVAGWTLFTAGTLGGALMTVAGAPSTEVQYTTGADGRSVRNEVQRSDDALFVGGIAVMGVSVIAGLALALLNDHAAIRVKPAPR